MRPYVSREADYQLENAPEKGKRSAGRGILMERTKTIKAGRFLECEIYPVVDVEHESVQRRKPTREAQRKVNLRNAQKRLYRMANENFGIRDWMLHLTMAGTCTEEEMMKNIRRFIRKMRNLAKKKGQQLKYIYVIETTGQEDRRRYHVHMLMNRGFCGFEDIEKYWTHGKTTVDTVKSYPQGLKGFALYITMHKDAQDRLIRHKWAASKGLKQPQITISDSKFSRAACEKLIRGAQADARALFEKKYPGYRMIEEAVIRYSDWMPGAYIYAMMEKMGAE